MKLSFNVDSGAVRVNMRALGRDGTRLALARTAEQVEGLAEAAAAQHSKRGALVRSIYLRRIGEGFEVGHDLQAAPHALFVHWGTRPHRIKPRRKKALRWPSGGAGFVFSKGVLHPGYKGDPWLLRAAARAPALFERHIQALLARIK